MTLARILPTCSPAQVQTIWCEHPQSALDNLLLTDNPDQQRIVSQIWQHLPDQSKTIQSIVTILAQSALALWPDWYGQSPAFLPTNSAHDALLNQYTCAELQASRPGISLPWLRTAVQACQRQTLPYFQNLHNGLQLKQLALAVELDYLILGIDDLQPTDLRLQGLAKTASWIATLTQARTILLIPKQLEQLTPTTALASVLYQAVTLEDTESQQTSSETSDETKQVIFPVQGRPHPFSPGEQKLAHRLPQDSELATLFQFNQWVQTKKSSQYLVDLLWREGKVIVEVDGYRHHGNRFGFSRDRNRDYELLISGYIVLRLPHDEVMADIEIALAKIREVVRFRQGSQA
jgi:very-short-patch-repair endonuclease/uncharacterized surface protein with fasciclin (FAS1) repeats